MKLIADKRCTICNEMMQQRSPVLIVADKYVVHLACWRTNCLNMTAYQTEKFIEQKLKERNASQ